MSKLTGAGAPGGHRPPSNWEPIETAPKDRRILFGGRFKTYDILPGGSWIEAIFEWSTFMSDGTGYQWISDLGTIDQWNVDWTHWHELPGEPND